MSFTIATSELDDEDFALLRLALDEIEQKTVHELTVAGNSPEAAMLLQRRTHCLSVRSKLRTIESGGPMNAISQIAEARASALSLRASAQACGPEHGALKLRLRRAAESIDATALLAMRGIDRVERLEQELRALMAADGKGGAA